MQRPRDASAHSRVLGDRIAELRYKSGFTQQELADRVAISRVALSNIELARTVPGERTVVLLAGVFDLEPLELVADTGYPIEKAERLPPVTARYTEVDHLMVLLERDLRWCEEFPVARRRTERHWRFVLRDLRLRVVDPREQGRVEAALRALGLSCGDGHDAESRERT